MNLSKHSGDKELFSETPMKENTLFSRELSSKENTLFSGERNSKENTLFSRERSSKENTNSKDFSSDSCSDLTDDLDLSLKDNLEKNKNINVNRSLSSDIKKNYKDIKEKPKLEKTTCRFIINSTAMPDIYELYCKNSNNQIEKYSYASIPDISTSIFIKNIFSDFSEYNSDKNEDINTRVQNGKVIYVECTYHKAFKKWIPYKKVDSIDSINTINQIQIILDSL